MKKRLPCPAAKTFHHPRGKVKAAAGLSGVQEGRRVVDQLHEGTSGNDGLSVKVGEFTKDGRAVEGGLLTIFFLQAFGLAPGR